jgi:hypothetical protein
MLSRASFIPQSAHVNVFIAATLKGNIGEGACHSIA